MPKQRQRFAQQSNRFSVPLARWVVPLICCVLLAGCADSDTERRFANDPTLTQEAAATATDQPIDVAPVTPTTSLASPIPVAEVLGSGGGAQAIYFTSGENLIALASPWNQPRTVWSGQDGQIVAFSASADGDMVAVLVSSGTSDEGLSLVIVDAGGNVVQQVTNVGQIDAEADTSDQGNIARLSWSPDGSRVVVAPPSGGLIAIPRSGEPVTLISSARLKDPGNVAWSPRGDAIAFVAPASPSAAGALYVATTAALPLDPIAVVPASLNGRRTISRVTWRPDGEALYYTVASTSNDPTFGGDLFEIPTGSGAPKLVATASRVGPVSAITDFVVSPDGRGVAYVVTVPRDDGGFADSLWLQSIVSTEVVALPVPRDERVTGLWWTTEGFVWQSRPTDDAAQDNITISRAAPGVDPGVIYQGPAVGTPEATPEPHREATPIAEASPVSGATPLASPFAAPAASPSAASPEADA